MDTTTSSHIVKDQTYKIVTAPPHPQAQNTTFPLTQHHPQNQVSFQKKYNKCSISLFSHEKTCLVDLPLFNILYNSI